MADSWPQPTSGHSRASGDGTVRAVLVALAGGAGLFLAWMAADTLFLIFAGLLLAALLDACTRGLGRVLPISRGWNLAIVCLGFAVAILGSLFWSGYSIALQIDQLLHALNQELRFLEQKMADFGFAPASASGGSASIGDLFRFLFPNPNQLFGQAQSAFSRTLGGIGDAAIFVLIGVLVAADPATYRERVLEFVPLRKRQSVAFLLDEVSKSLRRWLMGQLAAMLLLAVLTWIALLALGVPSSFLLGIQTGLLEFIPYLGSVIAAVPVFLMALPLGNFTVVVALALYAILHILVGMVIVPLIQKQTLDLPPALAVASLTLFGALFGVVGVAVATPLVIVIRQAVLHFRQFSSETANDPLGAATPK
jgi:predicted PurR-regulated permease PerM